MMETMHVKTSSTRNCITCNKAKVCKYQEDVTENIEKIIERLKQKEFPLLVDINCKEWSGVNPALLR